VLRDLGEEETDPDEEDFTFDEGINIRIGRYEKDDWGVSVS
jgi:hypothetical protein